MVRLDRKVCDLGRKFWWCVRCRKVEGDCNLNESPGRLLAALTITQLKKGECENRAGCKCACRD